MPSPLFYSIVSKLATRIPMFAKHIVTEALKKVGTNPFDVTPSLMRRAIQNELKPYLDLFLRRHEDVEMMGGGVIAASSQDELLVISAGARRLLGIDPVMDIKDPRLFRRIVSLGALIPASAWDGEPEPLVLKEIDVPGPRAARVNIACGPFMDGTGRILGVTSFLQDVTLRHALEEELDRLHLDLSEKVRDRTRELETLTGELRSKSAELTRSNQQLTQLSADLASQRDELKRLNQELKTLDRMKTDLLSNVSHELRTPLVSVKGYADLILDGALGEVNEKQRKGLAVVQRNINRLVVLIDELLDYSRLTSRRPEIEKAIVDLRPVITEAIDLLGAKARESDIRIETAIEPRPMPVMGDRNRLLQVMVNLVGNAVKFNCRGGRVDVRARFVPPDRYRVTVSDTGVGIPDDHRERVFDRFVRIHTPRSLRAGGIGLGLAICKNIVEDHGGTIWVESPPAGRTGAVLKVELPAHEADVLEAGQYDAGPRGTVARRADVGRYKSPSDAAVPAVPGGRPGSGASASGYGADSVPGVSVGADPDSVLSRRGEGRTVLVVDDEPDVLSYVQLVLEVQGYTVVNADSAAEALAVLDGQHVDLVLLDIAMEGMDGFQMLREVRRRPATRHIPVCIISAHVSESTVKTSRELGAQEFLRKPFAPDRLLRKIGGLLGE